MLVDILFIIGIIWLVASIVKCYRDLNPGLRSFYRWLFLAYIVLLVLAGL